MLGVTWRVWGRIGAAVVAGLLVFATLCAKETSVGFVGALPIAVYLKLRRCDGVDPGVARPQAIRVGIAAFVALVAYLGLRLAFVGIGRSKIACIGLKMSCWVKIRHRCVRVMP